MLSKGGRSLLMVWCAAERAHPQGTGIVAPLGAGPQGTKKLLTTRTRVIRSHQQEGGLVGGTNAGGLHRPGSTTDAFVDYTTGCRISRRPPILRTRTQNRTYYRLYCLGPEIGEQVCDLYHDAAKRDELLAISRRAKHSSPPV
jgi:hypothetical protein